MVAAPVKHKYAGMIHGARPVALNKGRIETPADAAIPKQKKYQPDRLGEESRLQIVIQRFNLPQSERRIAKRTSASD
jgi:hypothetical protein